MIKLVIVDIDGVMTNGTKMYDLNGNAIEKSFNDKDFTAIKKFKASGTNVCFLSGDKQVNENMAKNRNIDFYFSRENGNIDKLKFIKIFKEKYNVTEDEMAYIGDDDFDLDIMAGLNHSYCPADASEAVNYFLGNRSSRRIVALLKCFHVLVAPRFSSGLWLETTGNYILKTKGGEGVLDELYHRLDETGLLPLALSDEYMLEKIKELDSHEKL